MPAHPVSTYRLQIRAGFDLDAAAAITGYLADLGADAAYLSPLLQSTRGSDHGYDVTDPTRVDAARGGPEALERFSEAAREAGLGILADIVPNHMGISKPQENPWWWDVLTHGRASVHAEAFDIDWAFGDGKVRVPVLGAPPAEAIGDIRVDPTPTPESATGLARYFDHILPLAPGSVHDTDDLTSADGVRAVLDRQNWELRFWQDEAAELNYRRFFAVTTLAAVRVERPEVFDAAHAEVLRWLREGLVDGLRVDHPDGLADPGGYLARLAQATEGAYVLVEKILERSAHEAAAEPPETLPAWWATAGTTGYDALAEIERVLIDPNGEQPLTALDGVLRGTVPVWTDMIHDTKRMIADTIQVSEIRRLVRCLPEPIADADDALAELLACFPTYRSYLPAGIDDLHHAVDEALRRRPDLADAVAALAPVLSDGSLEVARRFEQTTGPVMAKGVEDTAFYRYTRLGSLTEVGGDPSVFSLSVPGFHAAWQRRQASWPHAMTTLSTHDTKRGEDVRARLDVLAELPGRWGQTLDALREVASTGNGPFDNLLWQAIVGSWPASPERLHAYAEKAAREAAEQTGWWQPDEVFEQRMHDLVDAAFGSAEPIVSRFVEEIRDAGWSNSLSAKLLQLAGPGVPDVYQGSELWETSLVDPDNRRPVDFGARERMLAELDAPDATRPPIDESGAAKLLVTSRALRLRRDRPELYTRYTPVTLVGDAADHAVAFDRGGVIALATRLPIGLAARGGWGDTAVMLPEGTFVDVVTGRRVPGGVRPLADVLATYPVALLATEAAEATDV
ncbi:malto-oligosyltrehalose synthase [Microbacterium aquimaris]|uniref:Malto-oligosyltrehalose synthase n=1 Tax=Microbacterium aquimaris TaxID=459816 RepID=A0ABU5N2L2_9MICO|nr:malto-oligosyltrehalose synthase [Microbacterium aquimaris]MDZ8160325.1 malto-oligosyltrehalose synthase [Microbacterium aquimaris]